MDTGSIHNFLDLFVCKKEVRIECHEKKNVGLRWKESMETPRLARVVAGVW